LNERLDAAAEAIKDLHEQVNKRKGVRALSEHDAYLLRLLQIDVGVSDSKLNLCLAVAHLYLTGRVIPEDLMWGRGTVAAVVNRLQWYEKKIRKKKLDYMAAKYPRMSVFLSSDDSKGRHAVSTAYPYIDEHGNRTVERELITVSHYVKKKDAIHAKLDKDLIKEVGYPTANIDGGNTDHPAESEIRELVRLCHELDPNFLSR
jgi:hypothetical protein